MQQVTVGSKYQIVIPKEVRKKMKNLKPGSRVVVKQVDSDTVTIETTKTSWIEKNRGIAKQAWRNLDTTKYLESLRDEWNKKY